jgi:hypothetical protein
MSFGIAPKLALYEHRQAGRRNHENIDRPCGCFEFGADRHWARKHRLDLGDGQTRRMGVNECFDVGFAHCVAVALEAERRQKALRR